MIIKKSFLLLAVAGIVAIAMFNVRLGSQNYLSDIVLENIEALTGEITAKGCCPGAGICVFEINGTVTVTYNMFPC
jgi:hypothetical protein